MSYPTTAHTLLDNIRHNLDGVRARVGGRQVLAAVKADAYGHGAVPVANMKTEQIAADCIKPVQFARQHILSKIAFIPAQHG